MKPSIQSFPSKIIKKEIKNQFTHPLFYKDSSINWFRNRYPENFVKKSIFTLIPNNGIPTIKEESSKVTDSFKWLNTYCKLEDKHQNIKIHPKYFFSRDLFNKILKLKEIFLQFDEDGSRKMEIDEIVTMFKTNHIDVTEEELRRLFFKGDKYNKQDINKLDLDFYQFIQFALNKNSDQDFRSFMRKIKDRLIKEKQIENEHLKTMNEIKRLNGDDYDEDDIMAFDERNGPIYLPMNFNLVLEYFINKGKERESHNIIKRGIKHMNNIVTSGTDSDIKSIKEEDSDKNKDDMSYLKDNDHCRNKDKEQLLRDQKELDSYTKQLKDINTKEILNEFSKLFKVNYTITKDSNNNKSNSLENNKENQQIIEQKDKILKSYNINSKYHSNTKSVANLRHKSLSPSQNFLSPDRTVQDNTVINSKKRSLMTESIINTRNIQSVINVKSKKNQSIRLEKASLNNFFIKKNMIHNPSIKQKVFHNKTRSVIIPTINTRNNWRLPKIVLNSNTNTNSITTNSTMSKNFMMYGH